MIAGTVDFEANYASHFRGTEWVAEKPRDAYPAYNNMIQGAVTTAHVSALRQELAKEIPDRLEGLDIARVEKFFAMLGLPRKDFIVLDQSSLPTYDSIVTKYGWPPYPELRPDNYTYGTTQAGLNIPIVLRDTKSEALHGKILTESTLVHELAHATSDWNEWSITRRGADRVLTARRMGQIIITNNENAEVTHYHPYLEEGFAAKLAGDYVEMSGENLAYRAYSDIAADGLQLLIKREPELERALLTARSDVAGLREVPKIVNSLVPGLYDSLKNVRYNAAEFQQATSDIKKALGFITISS